MIRVLIVDDDKLVRKGMIATMPWEKYGMEVVGEASNGKNALEFLSENKVDLLITDISMPIMSGMELLKSARHIFPSLNIVLLTVHENFEFIQQALRLGAIDYICKLQLEQEGFDEILERISLRISEGKSAENIQMLPNSQISAFTRDIGYTIISTNEENSFEWIYSSLIGRNSENYKIDNSMILLVPAGTYDDDSFRRELTRLINSADGFMLILLRGISGSEVKDVLHSLELYHKKDYFYDIESEHTIIKKDFDSISLHPAENAVSFKKIRDKMLTLQWIYYDEFFIEGMNELKSLKPKLSQISYLLHEISAKWNDVFNNLETCRITPPDELMGWNDVQKWFDGVRRVQLEDRNRQKYSTEVTGCILKAVQIVNDELNQQLIAGDVADRVNMSRSYLCRCFKDIVGRSFNDYLRFTRVEKAKELLTKTDEQVQWISEYVGYMNQKYFSHVFQEFTGVLPSKYRQIHSNSHNRPNTGNTIV